MAENIILTDEQIIEIEHNKEKRLKEQVSECFAKFDARIEKALAEGYELEKMAISAIRKDQDAELQKQIDEAQVKAAAEVTENFNRDHGRDCFYGKGDVFKEMLKGLKI